MQQPLFLTSKTAKKENPFDLIYAKTYFETFDKLIYGLARQNLTVISGFPGSGKSTWLSQLCINLAEQGETVAMFSGELTASMVFAWFRLQSAGTDNVYPVGDGSYYSVRPDSEEQINNWLENKIYVYNNEYGDDHNNVLFAMKDCIKAKKCRTIILDNLMTLDISKLEGRDKFEKQSAFCIMMKKFARDNNIHVIVVAHPRKTSGFLRVGDISGSGDIRGVSDNIFLIHRMDADTLALIQSELKMKKDSELFICSNAIEIAKSRFSGHNMGKFVPMYFDIATKRFKSRINEREYQYAWNKKVIEVDDYIVLDDSVEAPFDL